MKLLRVVPEKSFIFIIFRHCEFPQGHYNLQVHFQEVRVFSPNPLQIRFPMKPTKASQDNPTTFQLFQSRLDNLLNPDHPLCHRCQWSRFDEAYAAFYCEDTGAPGLPTQNYDESIYLFAFPCLCIPVYRNDTRTGNQRSDRCGRSTRF